MDRSFHRGRRFESFVDERTSARPIELGLSARKIRGAISILTPMDADIIAVEGDPIDWPG